MMKSRNLLYGRLSIVLILALTFTFRKVTAEGSILKTVDLYPSFLRCLRETDKQERAKLFYASVLQPYPEIYGRPETFKTDPATVSKYLDEVRAYLPSIRKIHERLIDEAESIVQSFCMHFSDFDRSRVKVYFMLSLFHFDGKIPHDNPRALFLALDGLAKFHGAHVNLGVMLSHELFHLYHFQVNPLPVSMDEVPLYREIWQEGLATYASHSLNSDATLADVLLDPQLASDGPKFVPTVARALLTQLEATDDETTARYFFYWRGSKTPSRMGYLIGYDIVAHLTATRSLKDLSRLRGARLLHLIREEVRALAAK